MAPTEAVEATDPLDALCAQLAEQVAAGALEREAAVQVAVDSIIAEQMPQLSEAARAELGPQVRDALLEHPAFSATLERLLRA